MAPKTAEVVKEEEIEETEEEATKEEVPTESPEEAYFLSLASPNLRIVLQSETVDRVTGANNGDGVALQFVDGIAKMHKDTRIKSHKAAQFKSAIAEALRHPDYGKTFWAHPNPPQNAYWIYNKNRYKAEDLWRFRKDQSSEEAKAEMAAKIQQQRMGGSVTIAPMAKDGRQLDPPIRSDGRLMPTDEQMTDDELIAIGKEHLVEARKKGEWP